MGGSCGDPLSSLHVACDASSLLVLLPDVSPLSRGSILPTPSEPPPHAHAQCVLCEASPGRPCQLSCFLRDPGGAQHMDTTPAAVFEGHVQSSPP